MLDTMLAAEKKELRELAIRGGPWAAGEPQALMDYCETDVAALDQLIRYLLPLTLERQHGLAHALIRGRAMAAMGPMSNTPVCRSMWRCWNSCARSGATSSTS